MLSALLLLLGLLAPAPFIPDTAALNCSQSSQEKCQNLKTATGCNAIEQCWVTTWKRATISSPKCVKCREVVKTKKKENPKASPMAVLKALGRSCKWNSNDTSARCEYLLENNPIFLLNTYLKTPANPARQLCVALNLCQLRPQS